MDDLYEYKLRGQSSYSMKLDSSNHSIETAKYSKPHEFQPVDGGLLITSYPLFPQRNGVYAETIMRGRFERAEAQTMFSCAP